MIHDHLPFVFYLFIFAFTLSAMPYREFHYRWEYDLKSSPETLWPFVSDTNRFNRDTSVPALEVEKGKASAKRAASGEIVDLRFAGAVGRAAF